MSDIPSTAMHHETPALVAALSDRALRGASSAAIFQRGRIYANSGAVDVMSEEPGDTPAIYATVTGTEPYSTEVWIHDGEVGGTCDCANAQDGWFCKHQVALGLVWRERLGGELPAIDEQARKEVQATSKRAKTVKDRRQALHDFLHSRSAATLADRLLDLADRDHEIARELQQWRKLSEAPQEAADLKALVTDIMSPGHSFISWRESHGYVHRAEAVLRLLAQTREHDPRGAASLSLHAMRRGWAVLMQADDSNGDIGGLIQAIGAEWVAALRQSGPQPATFGDTYLQLLLDDPFGCFDTAAAEAAMGDAALGRFRKTLAARWREAKDAVLAAKAEHAAQVAKANKKRAPDYYPRDSERDMRLWTLQRMHLRQLEAQGDIDIDGALAVMREDMSEAYSYQQVTAFLERHARLREAFANAELGCRAFPNDSRLQEDLLRCYERDGWVEEALALRRRRFDDGPSVERYHAVLKAAVVAGRDAEALRDELQSALVVREDQAAVQAASRPPFFRRQGAEAGQRDVSLRAEVLCSEERWDEALALVRPPAYCRDGVLAYLARRLGPEHLAQRIELLMQVFASEMRDSKSPYRHELALVDEIAGLLDAVRRAAWLEQLRIQYKAKKNFVRDLPVQ